MPRLAEECKNILYWQRKNKFTAVPLLHIRFHYLGTGYFRDKISSRVSYSLRRSGYCQFEEMDLRMGYRIGNRRCTKISNNRFIIYGY